MTILGTRLPTVPFGPLSAFLRNTENIQIADELGVARNTVARWRRQGIPAKRADELAVSMGVHPASVWGDDWWKID